MILPNAFIKWLLQRKEKVGLFNSLLLRWEHHLNVLLLEMKTNKNYDQLQVLEEILRRSLLKTLEIKGEVASTLMKKDFEMNKELLAKIQEQNQHLAKEKPHPNPRFGLN